MKEITGNFWDHQHKYHALVCTINQVVKQDGRLVMGRGIAKDFDRKYPSLAADWGNQVAGAKLEKGECNITFTLDYDNRQFLIGIATKDDWRNKSPIELVERSLIRLKEVVEHYQIRNVLMTRPGCGNGGLEWFKVRELMSRLGFDDRYTVINGN